MEKSLPLSMESTWWLLSRKHSSMEYYFRYDWTASINNSEVPPDERGRQLDSLQPI
jgi:hypothetical protein